jgi:hypothetical protein
MPQSNRPSKQGRAPCIPLTVPPLANTVFSRPRVSQGKTRGAPHRLPARHPGPAVARACTITIAGAVDRPVSFVRPESDRRGNTRDGASGFTGWPWSRFCVSRGAGRAFTGSGTVKRPRPHPPAVGTARLGASARSIQRLASAAVHDCTHLANDLTCRAGARDKGWLRLNAGAYECPVLRRLPRLIVND